MRATVLTEVVDKKSGRVTKRFVQPSRSFTEGLMSCLYVAQAAENLTVPRAVGYTGNADWGGTGVQDFYQFATNWYALRVSGNPPDQTRRSQYSLTSGGGTQNQDFFAPYGILFGEGDTAVSSYDRSLEKPMGISALAAVAKDSFDTLFAANSHGHFHAATNQWYFLTGTVNPNLIQIFDIDGVWQSTLTTNIANTNGSACCFVEGGFMYALKTDNIWYKIDLVTGFSVLTRSIVGDGHGATPRSCWYDDVAGNIVGIGGLSGGAVRIIRWSLVDFTVAVAASGPIDFNRITDIAPQTIWRAYPIDAARQWALGESTVLGSYRLGLLDIANLIWYPMPVSQSGGGIPGYHGSGLDSNGWLYIAHTGTAAVLMRVFKFYVDFRNLRLLPTYCNVVESDAVSGYFDIVGSMENNTGGNVTVREVGIHALTGAMNSPLIARDVLAAPVVLPTGQVIRTTYRLSASI